MSVTKRVPCEQCPFVRAIRPGYTGGSDPAVFVGQACGPFVLACHMDPDYYKNRRDPSHAQCVGAAIFRANLGVDVLMPKEFIRAAPDTQTVFGTPEEIIAHHRQISMEEAKGFMELYPPDRLLAIELSKTAVEPVDRTKLNPR